MFGGPSSWWIRGGSSSIQCRFWPCLVSLIAAVILLQILHLAMLSRLENSVSVSSSNSDGTPLLHPKLLGGHNGGLLFGSSGVSSGFGRQLQGRTFATVLSEMQDKVRTAHRLDKSGIYHLFDNFLPSELAPRGRAPYDVSLVTHCSTGNLGDVWELASRWAGPVSVAVFTYDDDFPQTVSRLLHLHFCNEQVFRNVNFHIVYPISRAPREEHLESLATIKLDCSAISSREKAGIKIFTDSSQLSNYAGSNVELAYPNNLLRNLGVNYAQTPYVFVIDVDMIPSEGLQAEFKNFMNSRSPSDSTYNPTNNSLSGRGGRNLDQLLQHKDHLTAFVVPAFEIKPSSKLPSSKRELLDLLDQGLVRPFYDEVCRKCNNATDYERWRTLRSSKNSQQEKKSINIGYSVVHADPWEPFYIARTSLPLYDERFKQYGFNRISQICEMHVAGFTFHVLDNAFLLHKGFKRIDGFHSNKQADNDRNRLLFRKFKEELKVKYPDVGRRC